MENVYLIELFKKSFKDKKTDNDITYYEVHLSDREDSKVFRMKPYATSEFEVVYEKAKKMIGKKVKVITKMKQNNHNEMVAHIIDIALA